MSAAAPEPPAAGTTRTTGETQAAPEPPAAGTTRTTGETQAIIRTIVGTGISLATLMLMLAGLIVQQNAITNARIDDVNTSLNARFDDMNARFDDMNARFDDLQEDVRELRALLIDTIKRIAPAD